MIVEILNQYETHDSDVFESLFYYEKYIQKKGLDPFIKESLNRYYRVLRKILDTNKLIFAATNKDEKSVYIYESNMLSEDNLYRVKEIFEEDNKVYAILE